MRIGAALIFLLLAAASAIYCAEDPCVSILVTFAAQDSPVRIKGLKLPEVRGGPPLIVVHNETDKNVSRFFVSGQVGNPRGVGGAEPRVGASLSSSRPDDDERRLAPNQDLEVPAKLLESHNIAIWAKNLKTNCLHVDVLVTRVEFSDRTTWEDPTTRTLNQGLWGNSINPESTKACDDSPKTTDALNRMEAAGHQGQGMPLNIERKVVDFYSVSCPLVEHENHLDAICEF